MNQEVAACKRRPDDKPIH